MSAFTKISLMTVLAAVFFSSLGFAELMSGEVAGFDSRTRKLTLKTVSPESGAVVNSEIWVNADAELSGINALENIKKGDRLWAEAEPDSEGNLRAVKITRD